MSYDRHPFGRAGAIPSLRHTTGLALTIAAVGARRRLTQSSLLTAVGIILVPRRARERDVFSLPIRLSKMTIGTPVGIAVS